MEIDESEILFKNNLWKINLMSSACLVIPC